MVILVEVPKPILSGGDGNKRLLCEPTFLIRNSIDADRTGKKFSVRFSTVLSFEDVDELVQMANSTIDGLAAAIWNFGTLQRRTNLPAGFRPVKCRQFRGNARRGAIRCEVRC